MRRCSFSLAVAASCTACAARAQVANTPTGTSRGLPPAHALGAVEARAPEPLASLAAVRALSGGRVLVNDSERKRILLFDSTQFHLSAAVDGVQLPVFADSLPLLRVDLATRKVDTAAFFRIASEKFTVMRDANGHPFPSPLTDPLPVVDDWAVLSDGTIILLRGQDFHADLVSADGVRRSAPKVPHEWQRMTDEQKVAFLDSTKAATEKLRAEIQARLAAGPANDGGRGAADSPAARTAPSGSSVGASIMISTSRDDGPPGRYGEPPPRGGAPAVTVSVPAFNFIPAGDLPDYKPPFARGGARADLDGRVWVRLIATRPMPGPVYDVIDGQGRLVDRVVLPPSSAIAGFGPGGVVYLGVRESGALYLQRVRVRWARRLWYLQYPKSVMRLRLAAALDLAVLAGLAPITARAQQPGAPSSASLGTSNGVPPARPLGAVDARAPATFTSLASVRALPGGRVLVNDVGQRRVLLFDSTLATFTVVADSTSATGNAYAGRIAGLVPYRGDSTLFVDPQSLSMLVVDPAGKLGRTLSIPRPNDAFALTGLGSGTPGFDARGRLVYRAQPAMSGMRGAPGAGTMTLPTFPDSAPIVRVDLATRKLDTVTFVRLAVPKGSMSRNANGDVTGVTMVMNPLPVVDDWAVLSDGTIAVLRGRDFHADLVGADGTLRSAPKMPHNWQRLSDEAKVAFLDSTRAAMEKQRADMQTVVQRSGNAMAPGIGQMRIVIGGPGGEAAPPPRTGGTGGPAGGGAMTSTLNMVTPGELPDYKPPFAAGGARADADGRVWVRLIATTPMPGPVYAVVDGQGREVDRVVLPPNSAILGFGPGGLVYLGVRDAAGLHLQRAHAR